MATSKHVERGLWCTVIIATHTPQQISIDDRSWISYLFDAFQVNLSAYVNLTFDITTEEGKSLHSDERAVNTQNSFGSSVNADF